MLAPQVGLVVESTHQRGRGRRLGFDPWVRRVPWSRKWQPTPVFLPRKHQGQRSLVGYRPWGRRESDTTEQLNAHTHPGCRQDQARWVYQEDCSRAPRTLCILPPSGPLPWVIKPLRPSKTVALGPRKGVGSLLCWILNNLSLPPNKHSKWFMSSCIDRQTFPAASAETPAETSVSSHPVGSSPLILLSPGLSAKCQGIILWDSCSTDIFGHFSAKRVLPVPSRSVRCRRHHRHMLSVCPHCLPGRDSCIPLQDPADHICGKFSLISNPTSDG